MDLHFLDLSEFVGEIDGISSISVSFNIVIIQRKKDTSVTAA
jgi:hypothetical protein